MEEIKVLIADHEPVSRARMLGLVSAREGYDLMGVCVSGRELLERIGTDRPELLIQEVRFPDASEVDMLRAVREYDIPSVVIVTAFAQYAVDAFELRVTDYVLKPFSEERFLQALDVAQSRVMLTRLKLGANRLKELLKGVDGEAILSLKTRSEVASPYLKRLAVHTGRTITVIKVPDLDCIEGAGVYVNLYTGSKRYLLRETLDHLEERLDPEQFARIHRSTIINVDRVQELKPDSHGEYIVCLTTGAKHKLSRSRRTALEMILGRL